MLKRVLSYSFMMMLVFTVCIGIANAATEEREDGGNIGENVITVDGTPVTGAEAQAVQQQVLGGLGGLSGSVGSVVSIGGSDSNDDGRLNELDQQPTSHRPKVLAASEITDADRRQMGNTLGMLGTLGSITTSRRTVNGPWIQKRV